MQNFRRVILLALGNRSTILSAVVCSAIVALLWGANLGLVKPMIEIVFSGRRPHAWIDWQIQNSQQAIAKLRKECGEVEQKLPTVSSDEAIDLRHELGRLNFELTAEEHSLAWSKRFEPYLKQYCPNDSFQALMLLVGILLVATITKDVFLTSNQILVERLAQKTSFRIRKMFFRRTLALDLAAFGDENSSRLMSRFTNDLGQLNLGVVTLFGKFVLEPLKMCACLVGAAFICWRLLLLSLLITPIAAFFVQKLAKSIKRANRKAMEEMSQIYALLSETFSSVQIVKAFTRERRERARFHRAAKAYYLRTQKISFYNALSRPGMEVIGMSIIGMAIVAGGYLVLNQQTHLFGIRMSDRPMDMASLIAFFALLAGAADPARKMSEVFNNLQSGMAAADRVFESFDREPAIVDTSSAQPMPQQWREIKLDRVSFEYTPGCPVLQDVSLRIPFGQTLAIVGPNGCGKSTLAGLLLRFYDPLDGALKIDDTDLRQLRIRDVREHIGFVNQQTQLFDDTVLENIRYGASRATDEQIIAAAKQAHAHKFITEKLENGYDTVVGERGSKLSGGQRQRIALARAILRDPSILILDEATSQIDVESEQLIHKVLEQFRRGRTTIMITHRLSTLDLADRIVVMDQGRIVDAGTRDELTRRCELFRRLYQIGLRESA
jgi:ATP-binding cassette subfamily B protein/subfamily B ATP-binding cassette protein MsbA